LGYHPLRRLGEVAKLAVDSVVEARRFMVVLLPLLAVGSTKVRAFVRRARQPGHSEKLGSGRSI
jgi:hypothetical protein